MTVGAAVRLHIAVDDEDELDELLEDIGSMEGVTVKQCDTFV